MVMESEVIEPTEKHISAITEDNGENFAISTAALDLQPLRRMCSHYQPLYRPLQSLTVFVNFQVYWLCV